jgi:N6-adenosine-specific RNA methylase IME4
LTADPGMRRNAMAEPLGAFRVVVADPPWQFNDKLPGASRGAEKNYKTLSVEALKRFALPPVADDAHLFLWRVASMQEEALAVVKAWGFVLKSEIVWLKQTKNQKRWFGMGRQVRAEHETCLIATRGRPAVRSKSVRSTFAAKAGRHSAKPDEFFEIVEQLCAGPYLELFARRERPGWTCLGDEKGGA